VAVTATELRTDCTPCSRTNAFEIFRLGVTEATIRSQVRSSQLAFTRPPRNSRSPRIGIAALRLAGWFTGPGHQNLTAVADAIMTAGGHAEPPARQPAARPGTRRAGSRKADNT